MSSDTRDPETYAVIGAAIEVHKELGCGFLEPVYHEALAIELEARNIRHRREAALPVFYKGNQLACGYRVDFICFDTILIELKAIAALTGREEAQTINYLKAAQGLKKALLINFGAPSLQCKRLAL
ncbi:GxxExxY protein [Asticcacaulis solisilvae]|uniref:GxxExxY protein n=1 Tax=Asticcacaulis solisilvae TaxID=1217274 RepID=UPI003FD8BDE9